MRTDTRFGGQLILPMSDRLSLTGQAVAEGYSYEQRDYYEPHIDRLIFAYQLKSHLRLRAGRLRTPIFMISKHYPVGCAYPWVTPPREVYNLVLSVVYTILNRIPMDGVL